jgi:hypothetical protein
MNKLISVLGLVALWPLAESRAQLYAPNEAGVSMAQWSTLVRDVEATKKFWMMLGGVPIKIDGTDVMKFPGVLVFLVQGAPTGGSRGTPVNHVGFGALSVQKLFTKINAEKAADVKVRQPTKSPLNGQDVGDVYSPDDLMIEVTEEAGVARIPIYYPVS